MVMRTRPMRDEGTVVGRPEVRLTEQQEAQIRQLGQALGVNPDMLIQAMTSVQIMDRAEGRPGLLWENPPQGEEAPLPFVESHIVPLRREITFPSRRETEVNPFGGAGFAVQRTVIRKCVLPE